MTLMTEKKLLIVDDEENMRHMLTALLERQGYLIETAADGLEALAAVKEQSFEFILCDVKMPRMDGIAFLKEADEFLRNSTVVMMSAFGSIDLALEAMKAGAYDFIAKPFKTDEVLLTLRKAEEREQLRAENRQLKEQIASLGRKNIFPDMVAVSKAMQDVFALAEKVARFDTTVLITGESGTGKELVARGIHERSPRNSKNFVAVNCGSLPENLLESELFGHVKGAFTGAERAHNGLFREADGGTLFLDEIAELPPTMQVKLLRVLQEQEIRPVGAVKSLKVNVRVIAATARDLEEQIQSKKFREDLFYRLNVVRVRIPPLRERREDIDHLCHHFVKKFNSELQASARGLSDKAIRLLRLYDWPGNIRELENVIQRGLVTAAGPDVAVQDLPVTIRAGAHQDRGNAEEKTGNSGFSLKRAQKDLEKEMIIKAMHAASGNKSRAAKLLELSYPSLLSKIKEYRIINGET